MKRLTFLLVLAFFCLKVFPVEIQPPRQKASQAFPIIVVPVMANNPGAFGAFFKTRVAIVNPTLFSYPIEVTLYNSAGPVTKATLNIEAGQVKNYENFLQDTFQYNGAGSVRFDSWIGPPGGSSTYDFLVTAEVYAESPNGKLKTIVANGAPPDSISQSFPAYSAGIYVGGGSRTNIGCFDASNSPNEVFADIFDSASQLIKTYRLGLAENGWIQGPVNETVTGGYIKWRATAPAYCYAVVVDNTSNDGTFIPATAYVTE